ncbi:phospholipid scramblase 1-like [Paroedura picta]|uniref:phospholipid scramblase 1-like n=1 Tax=Paroedura picta TaxID=143630 RepID=UPI0040578884
MPGNTGPHYSYPQYAQGPGFQGTPICAKQPASNQPAHRPPSVQGQFNAPDGIIWMPATPPILNCPPGLEYLAQIDQILIHQQTEFLEAMTSIESNNKYQIKNALGQMVYFAAEKNGFFTRNLLGPSRPIKLEISDRLGQPVMLLRGSFWEEELDVQAPPGTPIGYIKQLWDPCLTEFSIQNEAQEVVFKLVGSCGLCGCTAGDDFEVMTTNGESSVGRISKQWSGFGKEFCTDADHFGIQFPLDLDVKMKAVLLGACFLIDFMFYENGHH